MNNEAMRTQIENVQKNRYTKISNRADVTYRGVTFTKKKVQFVPSNLPDHVWIQINWPSNVQWYSSVWYTEMYNVLEIC